MFDAINNVVGAISGVLYQPWCVPLILLLGGLILTIRSKFIQGRMFTEMFKVVTEKPKTEGGSCARCRGGCQTGSSESRGEPRQPDDETDRWRRGNARFCCRRGI